MWFTSETDPEIRSFTVIALMTSTWHKMILLKAIKIKFLNNATHYIFEGPNICFYCVGHFIYIAISFCESAILLFPKSIIGDIEENLRK